MESTSVTNVAGVGAQDVAGQYRQVCFSGDDSASVRHSGGRRAGETSHPRRPKQAESLGLASIRSVRQHPPEVAGTGMRSASSSSRLGSRFLVQVPCGRRRSLPELPQRLDLHPGNHCSVSRDKSILTEDSVNDPPANMLSVTRAFALLGGSILPVAKARKAEPGS